MKITDEFVGFKFPTFEEIEKANKSYIESHSYKGYSIQIPVVDTLGLYLLIECQNDSFVFADAPNIIRFAWCNRAGFAVASVNYQNCEAGYLMGCAYLINSASAMSESFQRFTNKTVHAVRASIEQYNAEYSEFETKSDGGDTS